MNRCPIYAIPVNECGHCQRATTPDPHPTYPEGIPVAQRLSAEAAIAISDSGDYPPKPKTWNPGNGGGECGTCHRWWTGLSTAHCPSCHRNFTTITAFDKHRAGSHTHNTRHCVDPETIHDRNGNRVLVEAGRPFPCWGYAGANPRWDE